MIKTILISLVVSIVVVILGILLFVPRSLGVVDFSHINALNVKTAFSIGTTSPTAIGNLQAGKCNLHSYATTIAASSTALVDCGNGSNGFTAITGVLFGDSIQMTAPTTTSSTYQGLVVEGASASSTPGFIQVRILNLTGAALTWSAVASSSYSYIATR